MPYDPRHESEGGNRTTTSEDLKASKDQYRVVLVDTFDGSDCVIGNYDDKNEAIEIANKKGGEMTRVYVYDSEGKCIHSAGSF
tara:strand:+ start:55117 stop:55365 length:249 start_codon:yes stop_codon:yes gene_type:complete